MITLTTGTILFRLCVSAILALIIGIEREYRHQPAGIRTHILIGLGSSLFMIISIILPEMYESKVSDPGRIAAQVVSGVGFLGAGAIMKMGLNTTGLTTAANIWATAAIGLAVGAGLYMPAIIVTCLILFNLIFIAKIKGKFIKKKRYCSIHIEYPKDKVSDNELGDILSHMKINILTKNIKEDTKKTNIRIIAKINKNMDVLKVHDDLRKVKGFTKISISENVK